MDRQYKVIDNRVLDDAPLRANGSQHATKEEMRTFQSANDIYVMARLKPSGHVVADVAMQEKQSQSCEDRITLGMWNIGSMKAQHSERLTSWATAN